jgi:serine kinase of HPr protein (carbohydrate metabolism regulator)
MTATMRIRVRVSGLTCPRPARHDAAMNESPIHASCVAIEGHGVLLLGPSGAGKSDLTLRLIDRGAALISDDYCEMQLHDGRLTASAPPLLRGLIEVRGVGILPCRNLQSAPVILAVRLCPTPERMPAKDAMIAIAGQSLPVIEVNPMAASAPIIVEWALRHHLFGDANH